MGFKQQQIYAEAIGMSADELGNMLQTQEKNNELVGKFGPTGAQFTDSLTYALHFLVKVC